MGDISENATPLHWAIRNGHQVIVKFLLERGAKLLICKAIMVGHHYTRQLLMVTPKQLFASFSPSLCELMFIRKRSMAGHPFILLNESKYQEITLILKRHTSEVKEYWLIIWPHTRA